MFNKEQKFYSALKNLFVGAKLEGEGGYINLMNMKTEYFKKIEKIIKEKINNNEFSKNEKDELFDKLYTFFDNYFNDGGSIFFSSTPVYKNIYAKVYSDREDVSLFWKTKDLYYVKTEVNYQSMENLTLNDDDIFKFNFDAGELVNKKANEKKELAFYFIGLEKTNNNNFNLKFKIKYKESVKYDNLKKILNIEDTAKIRKFLNENWKEIEKYKNIRKIKNNLDVSILNFNNKNKNTVKADFLITEKENNLVKYFLIEPVITDVGEIKKYCEKKGLIIFKEDDILKAFRIYKRQNEIDYFIHKDAGKFLREQFDLFIYQYLANDLDTIFDQKRLDSIRKIKKIAYLVIDLIAKFEDELKKIWLKPKFVLNSNYVITLDRILKKEKGLELIEKIFNNNGIKEQIQEWKDLGIVEENFKIENIFNNNNNNEIFKELNDKYKHLPIDTKYFDETIKYEILSLFDNLDDKLDGWLIKSENFQALNTILPKFKEKVQLIYIDPPFNTGSDFEYIDRFQDSTWLTLMYDRIKIARDFLSYDGSFYLHLDWNANYLGRFLLNYVFGKENFVNEIIWKYQGTGEPKKAYKRKHDIIYLYSKFLEKQIFNEEYAFEIINDFSKSKYNKKDENGLYKEIKHKNGNVYKQYLKEKMRERDVWEIPIINANALERLSFDTQKPEILLKKIIEVSSNKNSIVLDFFLGSGTTTAIAYKLHRKWIGIELGEHFYSIILPRMKRVLFYDKSGISREDDIKKIYNEKEAGGFFKYYEIEQFEDTLRNAVYKNAFYKSEDNIKNVEFKYDLKLAYKGIEIDYKNEITKYNFENLYKNIDIPETISNLIGKKIKKITKIKVIFEDDFEVDLNNLTFEKYPFLKPLIWWE